MSDDPNVFEPGAWEREDGPVRGTRVAAAAGASELGATLYELDPGAQAAPFHVHHGNEELLIVLEGALELRTPAGVREIGRGAVVAFAAGPDGAHRVRNSGEAPARYLVVSTMRYPEVAEYPDTGAILAMKAPGDGWAWAAGADAEYMRIVREAVEADKGG